MGAFFQSLSALTISVALISASIAQEAAFVDLTSADPRLDLRRPVSSSLSTNRRTGSRDVRACADASRPNGVLLTSLISLDRLHYEIGDQPIFEFTIKNVGSSPVRIPISPHLADLQPIDPAEKFSFSEIQTALWIAADGQWSTNMGGSTVLYGNEDVPGTMLTLNAGEWLRVVARGHLQFGGDVLMSLPSPRAADVAYAESSLYRDEMSITATESNDAAYEICVKQERGGRVPLDFRIPQPSAR